MRVHQSRYQDVIGPLNENAGEVAIPSVRRWQQIDNSAIADGDSMIGQYQSVRLHWNTPASQNQGVTLLHYVCFEIGLRGLSTMLV
jgi:hypothetical protein